MSLSNHNAFETGLLNAHLCAYPLPSTGIHDPAQYSSSFQEHVNVEGAPQDLTFMKQAVCAAASVSFEAKKGLVFEAARPINHACFPSDRELPTSTRTALGSNMHGRCSEITMADNIECFVTMEGADVGLHSSDLDWLVRVLAIPVNSCKNIDVKILFCE